MGNLKKSIWQSLVDYASRNHRSFILLLSVVVGVLSAFAALILHALIRLIQHLLTSSFAATHENWLYLVFPVFGILITAIIVRYLIRDNISHGITRILYAISRRGGKIKRHNVWSSILTSALTIGFGGSVGAEAPIVFTGSAIGSNLGRLFRLDIHSLTLLVCCGAAGAIAGIFKAPIAGLVFTVEVLMIDLTMSSLLPLLISSITSTTIAYIFTSTNSLFTFNKAFTDYELVLGRMPAVILMGVVCGLVSLYFVKMSGFCSWLFSKLKNHFYLKIVFGGLLLSILIFLFPSLYGEGYNEINLVLNGNSYADWSRLMDRSFFAGSVRMLVVYLTLVIIFKVFATSATTCAGGIGGIFAPSLFLGAMSGFLFAVVWNANHFGVFIPYDNYALFGMAGLMSGVMHAPLTGIFLIAELTGGYNQILPLMIVSVISYLTIKIFVPHSIYANQLAQQGILLTHHTDHAVLTLMNLDSVIDKSFDKVTPDMKLGQLVAAISKSKNSTLPVVDAGGQLQGEVDVRSIRHIIFRTELYNRFEVSQLMKVPKAILNINDPMADVMQKFDETHAESLPVEDENGVLKGYIAHDHMLAMYRKMVADMSTE